jgi:hypothetical protein
MICPEEISCNKVKDKQDLKDNTSISNIYVMRSTLISSFSSFSILLRVSIVLFLCTSMSDGATFLMTSEQHHWFSGKISACQAGASVSIGNRIRSDTDDHDSPE